MARLSEILPSSAAAAPTTPSLPTIAASIISPVDSPTTSETTAPVGKYTASIGSPASNRIFFWSRKTGFRCECKAAVSPGESESSNRLDFDIEWRSGDRRERRELSAIGAKGIADNARKLRPLADKARHLFAYVRYPTDAEWLAVGCWLQEKRRWTTRAM